MSSSSTFKPSPAKTEHNTTTVGSILNLTTNLCMTHHAYLVFLMTYSHELALGLSTSEEIVNQGLQLQAMTFSAEAALTQTEQEATTLATLARLNFDASPTYQKSIRYISGPHVPHSCNHVHSRSVTTDLLSCTTNEQVCSIMIQIVGLTNQQQQILNNESFSLPTLSVTTPEGYATFEVHPNLAEAQATMLE